MNSEISYVRWKNDVLRTRITRKMTDFIDGYASLKALADAMAESNKEVTGRGAANISGTDLARANGTFGTPISEAKMTAIIKFLKNKNVNGFSEEKDVIKSKTVKFCDGLNYVTAIRNNKSRADFANTIGAHELEIEDAEKGRPIREELMLAYASAISSKKNIRLEEKRSSKSA